ncbi:potassium transporter Kup [Sphingomonas bacterium]|uniref:potassium transporter Kup n=1 Tax=Sphingomonas bacterium TaxID=1895847 RepID=UPI0015777692|nr:potassium transporter Kup [Sphingomonas bacterium]
MTAGLTVPQNADAPEPPPGDESHHHGRQGLIGLGLGAIGVVYGDIGTSPLYSMREIFIGHHKLAVDPLHILGVLSLIFWSLMIVVTFKYILVILRADNKGEGGSLALLALIQRRSGGGRWTSGLVLLGILATALFFGDCIITPSMSVLSAIEGLETIHSGFTDYVVPISVVILVSLFLLQSRGTAAIGRFFGPIMMVYFITIAVLGTMAIVRRPDVLWGLNPIWAMRFVAHDPKLAFLALGSVVLALTGAEALYADMGHFGRRPIQLAWIWIILPALMLNYAGQGALLLEDPAKVANPFFLMAGEHMRLPLVLLATVATVIASQAVITGAFSVVQQAVQLGLMPRVRIDHTSASAAGQIYVPIVNSALMVLVLICTVSFRSSSNLAAAYGIAVTGTMFITTCMVAVLMIRVWNWKFYYAAPLLAIFLAFDLLYLGSNLTKIVAGGWFPLLVGAIAFTLLTTWARGRQLMLKRMAEVSMPIEVFVRSASGSATRVPGTAVFMTSTANGVPHALLHNLKHNKVLHERIILLTVKIEDVPYIVHHKRQALEELGQGFYRLVLRFGFMEDPDVPAALARATNCGPKFKMMDTSFFLARQTLIASARPGMALWREKLFAWMLRNAESAMQFFRLPTNRVVELGSQVEI